MDCCDSSESSGPPPSDPLTETNQPNDDSAAAADILSVCPFSNNGSAGPSNFNEDISDDDFGSEIDDDGFDASQNMDDVDVDDMLEKPVGDVPEHLKSASKTSKRVLMYRGLDHFDVLPDGWIEVTHSSGLPVYLHKKSRCCTFSRPYFIGPGSVRLHGVPESAIPCLFYKRLWEEAEQRERGSSNLIEQPSAESATSNNPGTDTTISPVATNGNGTADDVGAEEQRKKRSEILEKLNAPQIKIKTADDVMCTQLTPDALHAYARRRIKFKNINVYRFGKWSEARNFYKNRKRNTLQANASSMVPVDDATAADGTLRPGLSGNVVLITVPSMDNATKPQQKPFCLNPQGKTSVCILHDLVQKILRCTVDYFFSETRNSATPYSCVAKLPINCASSKMIAGSSIKDRLMCLKERYRIKDDQSTDGVDDDKYITIGEGCGNSKKHARLMAAKKAVEDLLGGIDFDSDCRGIARKYDSNTSADSAPHISTEQIEENKFQIFDNLDVCDARVAEWSARAGQPAPYLILQEYLKRNAAFGDTEIRTSIRRLRFKKHRFDLYVGHNHHVAVDCANKREGKQKAAQAMLSKFLPENTTWGSILRLYGYEAQQKQKEAVKNKESIIKLQGEVRTKNEKEGNSIGPNNVILDKLKSEMMKISTNLVEKRVKAANADPTNDNGVPLMKRMRLEAAAGMPTLTVAQIDALEALLHAQKCRLRNEAINYSEMPILNESQMCELSAKLAQLFPDSDIKVPSLN